MTATQNIPDTLGALLAAGRDTLQKTSDSGRLDAELLLTLATGADRATLYANPDRPASVSDADRYREYIAERAGGRPVAYIAGEREFWSLNFAVSEHTLIPRPETELLVEQVLQHIPANSDQRVLDLGTGSGAVAAAIAHERPNCVVTATDHYPASLEIATQNFSRICPGRIRTLSSDWFSELNADTENYAVIVSNPPYVATNEKHLTDRELAFEPEMALYSGADGLDAIRIICAQAPDYLMAHGWLILEHGFAQAEAVAELLSAQGFTHVHTYNDLCGMPRVTEAQLG